jgi:hypothetical protein
MAVWAQQLHLVEQAEAVLGTQQLVALRPTQAQVAVAVELTQAPVFIVQAEAVQAVSLTQLFHPQAPHMRLLWEQAAAMVERDQVARMAVTVGPVISK